MQGETEVGPDHVVHVQQAVDDCPTDDYIVEGGYRVLVASGADRELFINKAENDSDKQEFVAMYAQGLWMRAWVEEVKEAEDG